MSMAQKDNKDMTALLQFEFDRAHTRTMGASSVHNYEHTEQWFREIIIQHALTDTLNNGGTFVLVVSDKTITVVQREDAEQL